MSNKPAEAEAEAKAIHDLEYMAKNSPSKAVREFSTWSLARFEGKSYTMDLEPTPAQKFTARHQKRLRVDREHLAKKEHKQPTAPEPPPDLFQTRQIAPGSTNASEPPVAPPQAQSAQIDPSAGQERPANQPAHERDPDKTMKELVDEAREDFKRNGADPELFNPDPHDGFEPPKIPKDECPF